MIRTLELQWHREMNEIEFGTSSNYGRKRAQNTRSNRENLTVVTTGPPVNPPRVPNADAPRA